MNEEGEHRYVIDREWGAERDRLRLIETWADPGTIERMARLGVGQGWRCLDLGAGAGSVARWLADQVAPTGRVVAADIDTAFLLESGQPALEILQFDATTDDFPEGSFDLIHTRMVLAHLPDRLAVMERMVGWLRPGGWLLLEEGDSFASLSSPNERWRQLWSGIAAMPGMVMDLGRALPAEVVALDVADVGFDIRVDAVRPGNALAGMTRLTVLALSSLLQEHAMMTGAEVDDILADLVRPGFLEPGPALVAVWAQRR